MEEAACGLYGVALALRSDLAATGGGAATGGLDTACAAVVGDETGEGGFVAQSRRSLTSTSASSARMSSSVKWSIASLASSTVITGGGGDSGVGGIGGDEPL
jgi:hypothetical protein